LLYILDLGSTEQSIAKQCARSRHPLPDRIANAPRLRKGLELYLQAFFTLDSERVSGWSVGRIPYSAVMNYAAVNQYDEIQTESLVYFVRAMDTEHLKRIEANRSQGK